VTCRVLKFPSVLPDLVRAIELQQIDARIGELEREVAALPRHIAQIEKTLESHQKRLAADEAALKANQNERKRLEGEIQDIEGRRSKVRDQMMGSKITNEVYQAFQHEIEGFAKTIRKNEDRILELMEESELLDRNVKAATTALEQEKRQVEKEKQEARDRTAADERQLGELRAARAALVAAIAPAVYAVYEKQRRKKAPHPVADATDGRCSSCQMMLRPQLLQEIKMGDEIKYCESCGSILYYNPPVALDAEIAAPLPGGQPTA
jgi:predicted  nucleic acid-binding Zn-ribbon protein